MVLAMAIQRTVVVHVDVQQRLDAARGRRDHGGPAGRWTRGERERARDSRAARVRCAANLA
jgi:hypothetical protein